MKTKAFLILLLLFFFCLLSSQVPQGFTYQAIARSGANPVTTPIDVRITVQSESGGGITYWVEVHSSVIPNASGLFNLIVGTGERQTGSTADTFGEIDWTISPKYIKTEIDNGEGYLTMGTSQLWSVPYSMVSGNVNDTLNKLVVTEEPDADTTALFEVRNKSGQTIFAVYNAGVRIYVDNATKGKKGGFAIGGFGASKRTDPQRLFTVSDDSIRMYIDDGSKGKKGGFAIGGFGSAKGDYKSFLNVSTDASGIVDPAQNRILWYPIKNAFLAGQILVQHPDSVGTNSTTTGFESRAKGVFSQAFGYKAIARGDYSTAIGKNAIADKLNSFAFGDNAKALNQDSYALGAFTEARGVGSFAFGYIGRDSAGITGKNTIAFGDASFALGMGCQTIGDNSFATGFDNTAVGDFGMAFGLSTKASGHTSTTFGFRTEAKSWVDMAIGQETVASGSNSFAGGKYSIASNYMAFSYGYQAIASGGGSIALGLFSMAKGDWSTAIGDSSVASGYISMATGYHTIASGDQSFSGGERSQATSNHAFAYGFNTLASGDGSIALGDQTEASGQNSFAIGDSARSTNEASMSLGYKTVASGWISTATGRETNAEGGGSFTSGYYTRATGWNSFAGGIATIANSLNSFVIGAFNDTTNMTNVLENVTTDPLFVIGNGTSHTDRKNAFTVLKNNNVGINMSNPQQMLDIAGGNGRVESGKNWLTDSDIRFKKNIVPIENPLQKVMAMNGVTFDLINNKQDRGSMLKNIGFIAQELENVIPEVVVTGSDGYKSVAYDKITAVLTEAIKEQQIQIETAKLENQQLKSELNELKALINNLVAIQTRQTDN